MESFCAELSLRNRRDRLLDIFLRKKSRSADGFFEEKADSTPVEEGLNIPAEIAGRQERKAQLAKARAEIEARAHARDALAYHLKRLHRRVGTV